ncbi:MAG: helix-turn-helix domain-containing protein [Protaetiibacter sp.]
MAKGGTETEPASTRTVDRALQLFTSVLDSDVGDSLSELARSTELSPSTASRLLATLTKHGLVQRTEEGRYRPGLRMKQLATAALADDPLYELTGSHLEHLVDSTHETASLGVAAGPDQVLYLRQVHSRTHQVQTVVWTGRTIPRLDTALGAALDGVVDDDGYRISRRADSDVAAVAAPLVGHRGTIPGAISINAPAYRTADEDLHRYGRLLVSHARDISLELGAPREAMQRYNLID